ncbi:MAG TPA: MAPEG family protein [Alphaproteobacteria bacterium]
MEFHPPLVTALWAGLNGLLALGLAVNVSRHRARLGIGIGDGGNPEMLQAIRLHANNAEYVALALVLLAIDEMAGAPAVAVHVLGALLLLGRILHAVGLGRSTGTSTARAVGVAFTWLAILMACGYALYLFAIGGR